ncbi:alpha/beta fold hydrolase [uncultured Streptomyces sp.]|uniref:alpha/beta fold hydrolase n=1 Tax=uncultured Streptomyces sp. TaxID=174707 RepID=UPI0026251144|nr:alpha/beta fold hydrolase [uncultured Streptomyces sp.]
MPRTTPGRRPTTRPLSALALLALVAGAATACGTDDGGPATTRTASASAAPANGTPAAAGLHMVDNGGHRLAFHVAPGTSSATVVLDAGGGEDSSYWNALVPRIGAATGATVITYDRAGLGDSDPVPGPWKVQDAVGDLAAGLRQLGVTGKVTLVSHSQAGQIATYFAEQHPKTLSGAVLVDANLPPLFTNAQIARLVAFSEPDVEAARKAPDTPADRQLLATAESFVETSKAFHAAAWPDSVPATVIVSEKTPFDGSPEDVRRWREAAAAFVQDGPDRTLVTARGSSHDVPKDRPALVVREIEDMVAARH